MSKKILFFGNERLATGVYTSLPTLQALLAAGYEVPAAVVAQSPGGKSRQGRRLEVTDIAKQHKIPLLALPDLSKAHDQLADFGAEAAVLIAYGKLVPQPLLDLFPRGIINVHPSLLPLYRGPTPIESAILNGATETGVSLMRLSAKMDAGPVYAQQAVDLDGTESKQQLANRLSAIGADMMLEYLPRILDSSAKPIPQGDKSAIYTKLITKNEGQLDWTKPATRLEREIRAYAGWPRSRTKLGQTSVIVTKAHVAEGSAGQPGALRIETKQLGVQCGKDVLVIDSLLPDGKKEMSGMAFLAGYNIR